MSEHDGPVPMVGERRDDCTYVRLAANQGQRLDSRSALRIRRHIARSGAECGSVVGLRQGDDHPELMVHAMREELIEDVETDRDGVTEDLGPSWGHRRRDAYGGVRRQHSLVPNRDIH